MIKRFATYVIIVTFLVFFYTTSVFAQDVVLDSEITYTVTSQASLDVEQIVTITNSNTTTFAKEITLALSASNPENVGVTSKGESLPFHKDGSTLTISLDSSVVGEGSTQEILLKYSDRALVDELGDVLEVTIPKLANRDSFNSYDVRIKFDDSLGGASNVTPTPISSLHTNGITTIYYDKETMQDSIHIVIGDSQVYSFNISYHLENPLVRSVDTNIALIPTTTYQSVYYDSISPRPDSITQDEEGNWIASYKLQPRERLEVQALGYVHLFAKPIRKAAVTQDFLNKNLLSQMYWQTDDESIRKLAERLKTPENIYNYVVSTLDYSYQKVSPTSKRAGAVGALNNPNYAICTEFTDLFITIARAAGIPAREVNGFAYTDNQTLQPLSLVADVLHAWPEYWDFDNQVWVPVDPTWGDTTGGIDYFHKLDLRHVSFVYHGLSSTNPIPPGSYKLGENPQKDLFISQAVLPDTFHPDISLQLSRNKLIITNNSGEAEYQLPVHIFSASEDLYKKKLDHLLPFQTLEIPFENKNHDESITAQVLDSVAIWEKANEPLLESRSQKALILIIIGMVIITFISIYAIYQRKQNR